MRFTALTLFVAAGCGLLLAFLTSWLPMGKPKIVMEMTSSVDGEVMLFYRLIDGSYHGDWRTTQPIHSGTNRLTLPFIWSGDPLRVDPPDRAGTYVIHRCSVDFFWRSLTTSTNDMAPARDILEIKETPEGIRIITRNDAVDPQLTLDVRRLEVPFHRRVCQIITALTTALLLFLLIRFHRHAFTVASALEQVCDRSVRRWRRLHVFNDFAVYLGLCVTLNIFAIANFTLSIDDEYAAMRTTPDIWVGQGRWGIYLIEKFLFEQPTIPGTPNLIFCICLALAACLLVRRHAWDGTRLRFLIVPALFAFPTWWFIQEFYSNLPAAAMGFLFVTMAACLATASPHTNMPRVFRAPARMALAALLIAFAISCYQSLVLLYAAIPIGIWAASGRNDPRHLARYLARPALAGVVGLVAYGAINAIFRHAVGHQSNYLDGMWRPQELLATPSHVLWATFGQAVHIYGGDTKRFGLALGGLMLTPLIAALITACAPGNFGGRLLRIVVLSLLLAVPFLLNLGTGGTTETRTLIAVPYVVFVLAGIGVMTVRSHLRYLGIIAASITAFTILKANGNYAAATWLATSHDRLLANDLQQRMGSLNPHMDPGLPIFVDVFGAHSPRNPYPSPPGSTMNASFFDWDRGNIGRMVVYMRLLGLPNLQIAKDELRLQAALTIFPTMPVWPAAGSVQLIDGIYYIRLGHNPDPFHQSIHSND